MFPTFLIQKLKERQDPIFSNPCQATPSDGEKAFVKKNTQGSRLFFIPRFFPHRWGFSDKNGQHLQNLSTYSGISWNILYRHS